MTPDAPSVSPSDEETPDPVSTAVCLGERPYNPDSTPYEGKGPHPMTIVHHDSGPATLELQYVTLPDGWNPEIDFDWTDEEEDHNKVQLVVCDDAVTTGGVMGTCTFDYPGMSGTMDVVQADHTFVVREARTGREVAEFSMQGTAGVEESCPSSAMDSGNTQIAQAVNDDAVAAKLRSLYEGPARKI
ncbi:hypothetical protein ABZ078_26860 [Streptomyces sp. NPDC006385]|uniref:hypothetical protein n=1 Tax=Streptomyces sp. NPDC006385 TaxID=3156761 RepID=UPI0033A3BA1D